LKQLNPNTGVVMPVYLFTFHGYRTWMPDHEGGYTRRHEGHLAPDEEMAQRYDERAACEDISTFDAEAQRLLIDEAMSAARHQSFHLHGAAGEDTHVHFLASWTDDRNWMKLRTGLKTSLSLKLNALNESRDMDTSGSLQFSRGAGRKKVVDRDHFSHLMRTYLPSHSGVKWFEDRGWVL
jgi:hypothetical protein